MSNQTIILYLIALFFLLLLSAFFSAAETGLMAINRYRLRHRARMQKRSAVLILRLLKRPDRLLSMILIGNTVSNIFMSSLATVLVLHVYGEHAVVLITFLLTVMVLVFCEVAPKTLAALYSEQTARIVAWPISVLLKLFYPLVWCINTIANGVLRLLGVKISRSMIEPLSREELRSIVYETAGKIAYPYQKMLLGILDLNKVTIEDVMVPRHQIVGIDLEQEWGDLQKVIAGSPHEWLPAYRENINNIVGTLHVREFMRHVLAGAMTKETLMKLLHEPYFIPEGTYLNVQLQNFQQQRRKEIALVVDEYGEILGLLKLKDILEEIVGEFTNSVSIGKEKVRAQSDGSYLVEGAVTIRELNRITKWYFPTSESRTLNGLIVEYLQSIPHRGTCVLIAGHPMEIIEVEENRVKSARVFPKLLKTDMGEV